MPRKLIVLLSSCIIFLLSCNTTEPPPVEKTITLTLEDAASIESWIKLTTTNVQLPTTVTLKQNDLTRSIINLVKTDTLLYIDSLLPNKTYSFHATIQPSSQDEVKSNELSVTTMDTTSHNFTWQSWTFGEHSSSVLRDVAIINENNIWIVGEIYMNDSLGLPDPLAYNAAHWDGAEWKFLRIMYYAICGQQTTAPYPASAVFAFDENDVWIAMDGDQVARINGMTQIETHCMPSSFSINKIWGTSSEDIIVVGNNGTIVRYNGTLWWKMFSGTDSDINDIWGTGSVNSNNYLILCAASNPLAGGEKKILRINNNKVDTLLWGTSRLIHSLWFDSEYKLFACGGGIFINNHTGGWIEQKEPPFVFTERVRGNGENDVFVVGHFGLISHYNGSGWKTFPDAAVALVYTSLDYENNLMVTVGYTQSQAVVQFMRRN